MRSQAFSISRTARVWCDGPPPEEALEVWFLLHGYAQRAASFLTDCAALDDGSRLLVAPEGLSRFYRRGGSGEIGASWMTKAERSTEIEDYVGYLDRVHGSILDGLELPLHVLGFSQGAATAARWVSEGEAFRGRSPGRVLLWGSGLPPEIDAVRARERFGASVVRFVLGEADAWVDATALAADQRRLREAGIDARTERFAGGHEIEASTLARLAGV